MPVNLETPVRMGKNEGELHSYLLFVAGYVGHGVGDSMAVFLIIVALL